MEDIANILGALQGFVTSTRRVSQSRTSLILVEQVVATLAACLATFSELETFATALQLEYDLSILDRLRLVGKEKDIRAVFIRLESHKKSLTLMLTILMC